MKIFISIILFLLGTIIFIVVTDSKNVDSLKSEIQQKDVLLLDYEDKLIEQKAQVEANKEFIKILRGQIDSSTYDFSYIKGLIEGATNTITDIKKLEEADKELLAKYSKIFFLNEHYSPNNLVYIPSNFLQNSKQLQIESLVLPFLVDMLTAMTESGLTPNINSAYRSFGYQADLKQRNIVTYGEGTANQFVADQGYSEHQLGTTVDIGSKDINGDFSKFKNTSEYKWLLENAYKYGFILSYPEDNTYYSFEPWHWRFVGIELATELNSKNKYFYDTPQREIDTYRLKMFDR